MEAHLTSLAPTLTLGDPWTFSDSLSSQREALGEICPLPRKSEARVLA